MQLEDLVVLVDDHWGYLATNKSAYSVQNKYEVVVYLAFEVTFAPEGDSVRVSVRTLDPEPGPLPDVVVAEAVLAATIDELDEKFRGALPSAYLAAVDAWANAQSDLASAMAGRTLSPQERRALLAGPAPDTARPPGETIALSEVPGILRDYFGDRVSAVDTVQRNGESTVEARVDGRLSIAITQNAQYGVFTAAVMLNGHAIGNLLGERLIARHSDESSVRELLDTIDTWLLLRLDR